MRTAIRRLLSLALLVAMTVSWMSCGAAGASLDLSAANGASGTVGLASAMSAAGLADYHYDPTPTPTTSPANVVFATTSDDPTISGFPRVSIVVVRGFNATEEEPEEYGPFHRRAGPQTGEEMAKARAGDLDTVEGGALTEGDDLLDSPHMT